MNDGSSRDHLLSKALLAGFHLGFLETIFAYASGHAPTPDVVGIVAVPLLVFVLGTGTCLTLAPLVRNCAFRQAPIDAGVLLGPVLLFGLRGSPRGSMEHLTAALTHWAPTGLLSLGVILWVIVASPRGKPGWGLPVRSFYAASGVSQLLAVSAFAVRTDRYAAFDWSRLSVLGLLTACLLIGVLALLPGRGASGGRANLRALLAMVLIVSSGLAVAVVAASRLPHLATLRAESTGQSRLNVLLIVLDAVRADHLSLYGYPRGTSRELELLARDSVVFDRAYANATYSLASHASLFTGRLPSRHGAHPVPRPFRLAHPGAAVTSEHFALKTGVPTIAEDLAGLGYSTAGISGNDVFLSEWTGLRRGFDTFTATARRSYAYFPTSAPVLNRLMPVLGLGPPNLHDTWDAESITDETIRWLGTAPRPFFLFMNYFDAHLPNDAPGGGRFEGDGLGSDISGIPAYDAEIARIDAQIGRLIRWLQAHEFFEQSLIIVTADHGEFFGEHGFHGHPDALYEPVLRVPLLLKLPASTRAEVVPDVVGLHQVKGWIANVARGSSISLPPHEPSSIAESWRGRAGDDEDPLGVLPEVTAVYDWPLKLIHRRTSPSQLFNLEEDPREAVDLLEGAGSAAVAAARRLESVVQSGERAIPGELPHIPVDILDRLRALGYMR